MSAAIKIAILANAKNAIRALNDTGKAADNLGKKTKGGMNKVAIGAGAAVAVAAVGAALKEGVTEATAYQDAAKQTTVALRSNAKLHGVTTAQVQEASAKIETLTGAKIDENEATLASNRLIRSGVTSQAALDRALKVSADVALGSGKDIATTSTALAKALANPAKAAGVLGKAGIILTEAQKKNIGAMAKSGDAAGAQAAIMTALEGKYKGASEAAGTGFAADLGRAEDALADAKRDIATALLPTLSKLATSFATGLPNALKTIMPFVKGFVALISHPAFPWIVGIIIALVGAYKLFNIVMAINNVILLANPVVLIVAGILLLIGVIVLIATKTTWFQTIWKHVWGFIKTAALAVFNFLKGYFVTMFNLYKGIFLAGVAAFRKVWQGIQWLWDKVVAICVGIKNVFVAAFNWVKARIVLFIANVKTVWAGILALVTRATEFKNKIVKVFSDWVTWMLGLPKKIIDGILKGLKTGWDKISEFFDWAIDLIPEGIKKALGLASPSKVMAAIGANVTGGLAAGIVGEVPALRKAMGVVSDVVTGGVSGDATGILGGGSVDIAGGGGAGGDTFIIHVDVAPGADLAEAGRLTVKAIEAHQRKTGRVRLVPA